MKIIVQMASCDQIEIERKGTETKWLRVKGCLPLLNALNSRVKNEGGDPALWRLPEGQNHVDMLMRELILKSQNQWAFPYNHEELCHCRNVNTSTIDEVVLLGAHQPEIVSQLTLASTACGTCRPDVEKVIQYRLHLR